MLADPALLVSRLVFVGFVVEAVEVLASRRHFAERGIFAPSTTHLLATGAAWPEPVLAGRGGPSAVAVAMAVQLVAAGTVVAVGLGTSLGIAAALACLVAAAYFRARRPVGGSGADQLGFIVLVTVALVWVAGRSSTARELGDAFLAGQVALAYLTAGVAKLVSSTWRSGRAMTAILSTEGYGSPAMARVLTRFPLLDTAMCWVVMAWEASFVLVFVLPDAAVAGYLAVGVVFHVTCAVVMGLNRFVWSFCGCYPAVWVVAVGG